MSAFAVIIVLATKLGALVLDIAVGIAVSRISDPTINLSVAILFESIESLIKTGILIYTGVNTFDLIGSVDDVLGEYTFKGTDLEWIFKFTSAYSDLLTTINTFNFNTTPSYTKHIVNYYVKESNYNVKVEFANGSAYTMSEIYNCYLISKNFLL